MLMNGYKKALENNNSTGHRPSKFAWMKEMEELVGQRHDIQFAVTGILSVSNCNKLEKMNRCLTL